MTYLLISLLALPLLVWLGFATHRSYTFINPPFNGQYVLSKIVADHFILLHPQAFGLHENIFHIQI